MVCNLYKLLLSTSLLIISSQCQADTELQCKAYMLKRETNGGSVKMQRAVLNVMHNRMRKWNKGACQVLYMKGQYPYMIFGMKPVSKEWLTHTEKLSRMSPLIDRDYIYFNTRKHVFGKEQLRVGSLWFSK